MNGCRDIPRGFRGLSRHRGHGMAFLLVDRITEIDPGKRARGQFVVPADLRDPSHCIVAEAVGQLAAWAAMAKVGFRRRPVAGLAGEVKFKERAAPGTILDLEVELESCDSDAVLYDGCARVGPLPIVEMSRCVGPMLPMEDFEAPEAARARFELLCGEEAPHQGFSCHAAVSPCVVPIDHDPGKRLRAAMHVPLSAPFFADHFPRKPVLPGTLLLDAQLRLAVGLAAEAVDPSVWMLLTSTRVWNVKLRAFVHPGQTLEICAQVVGVSQACAEIALTAEVGGQRISTARVETGVWDPR